VIDPNLSDRAPAEAMLRMLGFRVFATPDGEAALHLAGAGISASAGVGTTGTGEIATAAAAAASSPGAVVDRMAVRLVFLVVDNDSGTGSDARGANRDGTVREMFFRSLHCEGVAGGEGCAGERRGLEERSRGALVAEKDRQEITLRRVARPMSG